ncbi:MAG: hypothetical protein ACD_21C00250G0022 [uncultured bacterium]|nr:MAG: hypothetical protein ACD_21C00250G0022 [uncultured bacterium]
MCGITGFFSLNPRPKEFYTESIKKMADALTHRGPDDSGYWVDVGSNLALGHRRLSIIDLNPTGHQPMFSSQDRFVIVYNGEIYNYLDLKKELDKSVSTSWQGHSDTEVLLRGFEYWGIKKTLEKMCGMFAIAVFDKQAKKLILARDRIGEKPLYYGWLGDIFVFGSELKILKGISVKKPALDMEALGAYFRYGYIPAPYSIFQGIKKVLPGTYAEIDLAALGRKDELVFDRYWAAKDFFSDAKLPVSEAQNKLENILEHVIQQTMIGDVPIGAFLSGGIDSSLIVALMQKASSKKIKTFTIGFDDAEFNEAQHALAVAKHLGTDHTELYLTPNDTFDIIPKLPKIYDEPFADSSQLPTILISTLTRSKVTVALSGDGGDELFAGYTRYLMAKKLLDVKSLLPDYLNQMAANFILAIPNIAEYDSKILAKLGMARAWGLGRRAALTLKMPADQIYESIMSQLPLDDEVILQDSWHNTLQGMHHLENIDVISQMMYVDMMTYLPDDIMVKVDRAAMSVSLETRAPFLDRRVVEFACSLPLQTKLKGKCAKSILKNILYQYVPRDLLERPKQGFGVPIASWLRGPLKGWASDLLSREMLAKHGCLNVNLIEKKWHDHLSGKKNLAPFLWEMLMFQSWYSEYMES